MEQAVRYPTFWFLSPSHKVLNIIKDSTMIDSEARTLLPNTFFEVKTVSNIHELHIAKDDLAIVIIFEGLNWEFSPAYQQWNDDPRICIVMEKELHECDWREEYARISIPLCKEMRDLAYSVFKKG
jgi:hypothetical protein